MSSPEQRQPEADAEMRNIREWVLEPLREILPTEWRFVPYLDETVAVEVTTMMLTLNTVEHWEGSPRSHWLVGYDLFVIVPEDANPGAADDAIDAALFRVLFAIDEDQERLRFERVERGVIGTNLFYKIPLLALIKKVEAP